MHIKTVSLVALIALLSSGEATPVADGLMPREK
jgi:hypothetical protein